MEFKEFVGRGLFELIGFFCFHDGDDLGEGVGLERGFLDPDEGAFDDVVVVALHEEVVDLVSLEDHVADGLLVAVDVLLLLDEGVDFSLGLLPADLAFLGRGALGLVGLRLGGGEVDGLGGVVVVAFFLHGLPLRLVGHLDHLVPVVLVLHLLLHLVHDPFPLQLRLGFPVPGFLILGPVVLVYEIFPLLLGLALVLESVFGIGHV